MTNETGWKEAWKEEAEEGKERGGRERERKGRGRRVTNRETEQQHFNNTHICMLSRASGHVAGANMPWIFLLFSRQTGPRCLLFVFQPGGQRASRFSTSDTLRSCTLDVTWYPVNLLFDEILFHDRKRWIETRFRGSIERVVKEFSNKYIWNEYIWNFSFRIIRLTWFLRWFASIWM